MISEHTFDKSTLSDPSVAARKYHQAVGRLIAARGDQPANDQFERAWHDLAELNDQIGEVFIRSTS